MKTFFITLRLHHFFCATILLLNLPFYSQTFTDSNLPIVIIHTDGGTDIPDDPRVLASMQIIKRPDGTRNYMADVNTATFLNYNGRINIEIRGSSSQSLPKKGFGLTTLLADNVTNNNVLLLGMPSENDWILNALAFDPSLIRDYLSYNLSRQMGNYAPRTVYCEVVINDEYQGLYLLEEKIKSDSNRVNILKIGTADNVAPEVTGGYITKADKTTGGDPVAWTMESYEGSTDFIHDFPKPENVTTQQDAYIHSQFSALATTSHAHNTNLATGYPSKIDIPSFIDFMISNELASNVDAYQLSTYFHKDRNGKLRAGPVWDMNLTYGNDLFEYGYDRSKTDVWQFSNGDNEGAKFWRDLFDDPVFKCYLSRRWNNLIETGQPLNHINLVSFIDNAVALISEAAVRENQRWGTIPNQNTEISNLKTFLTQRTNWMRANIGSFNSCSSVVLPALVIEKINYNPGTSQAFPISNDLEFIEIKNAGATNVNATGIYFKELGISYQFPANTTIAAGQELYLASNPATFQANYGIAAFGQFTRNLSNNSQQLVLADGFGNIIDRVEYDDEAPWPDADGNGSYLQLISTSLDNALASNWVASNAALLGTYTVSGFSEGYVVYPNPVNSMLTIQGENPIHEIAVYDVLGHEVMRNSGNSEAMKVDCTAFAKGIYILKIFDEKGSTTQKIIKQ